MTFKDSSSLACRAVIQFPVSSHGKPHIYITLFPIAGAHRDVGSNPAKDTFF